MASPDRQAAAAGHGVAGIAEEIEKKLFQVGLGALYRRQFGVHFDDDLDAVAREPLLENGAGIVDRLPDVSAGGGLRAPASEAQHAPENSAANLNGAFDLAQVAADGRWVYRALCELRANLLNQG